MRIARRTRRRRPERLRGRWYRRYPGSRHRRPGSLRVPDDVRLGGCGPHEPSAANPSPQVVRQDRGDGIGSLGEHRPARPGYGFGAVVKLGSFRVHADVDGLPGAEPVGPEGDREAAHDGDGYRLDHVAFRRPGEHWRQPRDDETGASGSSRRGAAGASDGAKPRPTLEPQPPTVLPLAQYASVPAPGRLSSPDAEPRPQRPCSRTVRALGPACSVGLVPCAKDDPTLRPYPAPGCGRGSPSRPHRGPTRSPCCRRRHPPGPPPARSRRW
ncbi:MAG: hypothetical protein QOH66_715 [Actinomycetota bacterium]|nr:hypothetical protein [Actinomycetota bacterium]MEA2587788.1 hypothetical protein [Actinomycetota bacterium]